MRVRLDEALPGAIELLDGDERARAARFVFERDRRRFINAHAWLRAAIGRCADLAPEAVRFTFDPRGKPRLADEESICVSTCRMRGSGR